MVHFMRTIKFTSWQDDNFFIGFINERVGWGSLAHPSKFNN